MSRREAATPGWLGLIPGATLVALFLIPFAIMLAVSVAEREAGGFYQWGFDLAGYRRFLSGFFGGILGGLNRSSQRSGDGGCDGYE